jgi:hypothetical protein
MIKLKLKPGRELKVKSAISVSQFLIKFQDIITCFELCSLRVDHKKLMGLKKFLGSPIYIYIYYPRPYTLNPMYFNKYRRGKGDIIHVHNRCQYAHNKVDIFLVSQNNLLTTYFMYSLHHKKTLLTTYLMYILCRKTNSSNWRDLQKWKIFVFGIFNFCKIPQI